MWAVVLLHALLWGIMGLWAWALWEIILLGWYVTDISGGSFQMMHEFFHFSTKWGLRLLCCLYVADSYFYPYIICQHAFRRRVDVALVCALLFFVHGIFRYQMLTYIVCNCLSGFIGCFLCCCLFIAIDACIFKATLNILQPPFGRKEVCLVALLTVAAEVIALIFFRETFNPLADIETLHRLMGL